MKVIRELAIIGLMRSYNKLNQYDDVSIYADLILNGNYDESVQYEATYYKAKALFESGSRTQSATLFNDIVTNYPISSIRAESAYHLALIKHLNGDYQGSLDDCFANKNEYSAYEYWVVKTFILIADNYAKLDNIFQAKATLESIVNNYTGDPNIT